MLRNTMKIINCGGLLQLISTLSLQSVKQYTTPQNDQSENTTVNTLRNLKFRIN